MHKYLNFPILLAIAFYRSFLSPLKGYRCAYGSAGFGQSCSTYGKRVFRRFPATMAIALLKRRFHRCGRAARGLYRQRGNMDAQLCCTIGPQAAAGCCSSERDSSSQSSDYGNHDYY